MALFSVDTNGQLQPHLKQEFLLTNGLGGFAHGTVVGCNTRRYHGLLVAATLPPVGRIMALNRIGELVYLDGSQDKVHEFSVNQFRENFHPQGWKYLRRFELGEAARWEYLVDGVRIIKEVHPLWLRNVVGIRYTIEPDRPRKVSLNLQPFVSLRDFHQDRKAGGTHFGVNAGERRVTVAEGPNSLNIWSDAGSFVEAHDWWYNHFYAIENERGLGDSEDLFTPGKFVLETTSRATITIWASMEPRGAMIGEAIDWDRQIENRKTTVAAARTNLENISAGHTVPKAAAEDSPTIQKLLRAANDFVVYRKTPKGADGTTVIAGYPWFADWGRDTMIALPGLLLTTGRHQQARQVLEVFADYVSQGMIPNVFDDYSNEPHYNTVDASLWFIHAAYEYLRHTNDRQEFDRILLPACRQIIDGYRNGTRFQIRMDPNDALISQGDPTTQLTWMDAKDGDVVFTPRQGKPVEINALWYHALRLMGENALADRVADSFRKAFWISPFRGLADVVEGSPTASGYPRRDPSIRPNQIFAVSLAHSPLTHEQQAAVVEVVRRELLTPMGLRTLNRADPRYRGTYRGNQFERDGCYHNGVVWPWLIGGFLEAYLRVNKYSADARKQARLWLTPLIDQMSKNCIGQIHEIHEGDDPHRPVGCPAQAWSVAEVLRMAAELEM
ncbi:MAG TPA: amylo-alpha-1,6-glucosidase [Humisphaera sp.]|jgi:predicted glycogen debranching enzyme|nr:amylo-alpha-1,6-glucosidase [Humisphaera sp.]